MMKVDVTALAALARIELSDTERAELETSVPKILAFVEAIQSVETSALTPEAAHRNVMREDANSHEGGIYSKQLLSQAPARVGDRIAVKQVVSRKQK